MFGRSDQSGYSFRVRPSLVRDGLLHNGYDAARQGGCITRMEWTSDALVVGVRPHGETSVILEVMTGERGRHLGLVKGGRSRRMQPVLQPGNTVLATWKARLDDQLGYFAVELAVARAGRLMEGAVGVLGAQMVTALLRYLPEREPHAGLFEAAGIILDNLDDPVDAGRMIVRFEMAVLDELGFGLDLSVCAATGLREDLIYVSPRTGRAVSRVAGESWRDRLLPLPGFMWAGQGERATAQDVVAAFRLTGHFLQRHVAEPRGVPLSGAREQFIARLRTLQDASAPPSSGDGS